jgi:hypothetical protein
VEDYVRFKPGLSEDDENIFVTLGIVRWNAHGAGGYGGVTMNITPPAANPHGTYDFPSWTGIITDRQ